LETAGKDFKQNMSEDANPLKISYLYYKDQEYVNQLVNIPVKLLQNKIKIPIVIDGDIYHLIFNS